MRIGDVVRRTGVSQRLLRYYEEQGLLRPARLPNGYREYTEADVATVHRVRTLLDAGLGTAVIARLLDCVHEDGDVMALSSCPGTIGRLRREQARIAGEVARLQASHRALGTLLAATLPEPEPAPPING
ncbi:MerR family transcriptional regulator [Streptomyces sp. RFCAC02]|uniref:MerR family transcriptional regulator n=1 Tax=Streptomyces sp. RFCAC02 TaxID=2499143 RepID=UPI0010221B9A|nr:MerR family transcriptional regulator [Streptomyces sp. RFCAC02]